MEKKQFLFICGPHIIPWPSSGKNKIKVELEGMEWIPVSAQKFFLFSSIVRTVSNGMPARVLKYNPRSIV